jgi:hypothetical protein
MTAIDRQLVASPAAANRGLRIRLRLGLIVALGGAVASMWSSDRCAACQSAHAQFGGVNIALIGMIWYALLIAAAFVRPNNSLLFAAVFYSFGVHLALVTLLVRMHTLCIPCAVTALGAFIAGGTLMARQRPIFLLAACVIPLGFVICAAAMVAQTKYEALTERREVQHFEQQVLAEKHIVPLGRIYLLFYYRAGCEHCEAFRSKTIPLLRKKYGPIFDVEERPIPTGDYSTPMIVLQGPSGRVHGVLGNLPLDDWDDSIQYVLSGNG